MQAILRGAGVLAGFLSLTLAWPVQGQSAHHERLEMGLALQLELPAGWRMVPRFDGIGAVSPEPVLRAFFIEAPSVTLQEGAQELALGAGGTIFRHRAVLRGEPVTLYRRELHRFALAGAEAEEGR